METREEAAHEILAEAQDQLCWTTHTVFKSSRDRFGHEATYPTAAQAQAGADALGKRHPEWALHYETRVIPWYGAFRVQYRIKEGGK